METDRVFWFRFTRKRIAGGGASGGFGCFKIRLAIVAGSEEVSRLGSWQVSASKLKSGRSVNTGLRFRSSVIS